jgi:hypothetical protein
MNTKIESQAQETQTEAQEKQAEEQTEAFRVIVKSKIRAGKAPALIQGE